MSLKNVRTARRLRGQGFTRTKRFFFFCWSRSGSLAGRRRGLPPPPTLAPPCFTARFDFHSRGGGCKSWRWPPKRPYCAGVCSLSRAVCASLTSQPLPIWFPSSLTPLHQHALLQPLPMRLLLFFSSSKSQADNWQQWRSHSSCHRKSWLHFCQIPEHLRDKQLSQN